MPSLIAAGVLVLGLARPQGCLDEALVAFSKARERTEALRKAFDAARGLYFVALHKHSTGVSDLESAFEAERDLLAVEEHLKAAEAEEMSALAAVHQRIAAPSCDDAARRVPGKRERFSL